MFVSKSIILTIAVAITAAIAFSSTSSAWELASKEDKFNGTKSKILVQIAKEAKINNSRNITAAVFIKCEENTNSFGFRVLSYPAFHENTKIRIKLDAASPEKLPKVLIFVNGQIAMLYDDNDAAKLIGRLTTTKTLMLRSDDDFFGRIDAEFDVSGLSDALQNLTTECAKQ